MLGNSQTDTKVNTEDNFSGFQLIIKDRSNKNKKTMEKNDVRWESNPQLASWNILRDRRVNNSAIPTLRGS